MSARTCVAGPSLSERAFREAAAQARRWRLRLVARLSRFTVRSSGFAARLREALARRPAVLPGVVLLLVLPLAIIWVGASMLAAAETRHVAAIRRQSAPALAALARARAQAVARARLAPLLATPTIGATTVHVAAALPADAELTALGIEAGGALTATIAAPDPDRLRDALRGDALLGHLRESGQSAGNDGRMRITLRGAVR